MGRPSNEDNLKCYHSPEPGNVWHEMMCVYHIVLAVTGEDTLVIAERDLTVTDGQDFDLTKAKEITKEEHKNIITYSGNIDPAKGPAFVADVWPKVKGIDRVIDDWKVIHEGKYLSIAERKQATESAAKLMNGGVQIGMTTSIVANGKKFTSNHFLNSKPMLTKEEIYLKVNLRKDSNGEITSITVEPTDLPK